MSRKKYNYENKEIVSESIVTTEVETKNDISDTAIDNCVDETIIENSNVISCKVETRLPNGKAIVVIDGCGLIISVSNDINDINIKCTGKIGKPDFKYEVV